MSPSKYARKKKLIQPRLQLRLVGSFFALCGLTLVAQALVLGAQMMRVAETMPLEEGRRLADALPWAMGRALLFSFLVLLPALLLIGVRVTFKIAGPIYRFERHLDEVRNGGWPGPCKIRKTDELQDFCDTLNDGLESAYAQGEAAGRAAAARSDEHELRRTG